MAPRIVSPKNEFTGLDGPQIAVWGQESDKDIRLMMKFCALVDQKEREQFPEKVAARQQAAAARRLEKKNLGEEVNVRSASKTSQMSMESVASITSTLSFTTGKRRPTKTFMKDLTAQKRSISKRSVGTNSSFGGLNPLLAGAERLESFDRGLIGDNYYHN